MSKLCLQPSVSKLCLQPSVSKLCLQPSAKILHLTSALIFVPAIVAASLGRWVDVAVIVTQAVTSIWVHTTGNLIAIRIDQTALAALATRTLTLAVTGYTTIGLYILGFGYMLLMYTYGFYAKRFCYDPDPVTGNCYHASIHILGIAIYTASMVWLLPS